MKVYVLRDNFLKEKNIFFIFLYFLLFVEKWNLIFWKNYANFLTITQTTRCNFWLVSQFSKDRDIPMVIGKLRNQSKFAPGGLRNCQTVFFLKCGFWRYRSFTIKRCFNAPKWAQMHHKWVNTIPFRSGYTLGTLNHGLGSLFCGFITLFGAGGILDPPGTPWGPLAPPWTPWCPHDPWYVILGHSQSSWVIMSHIWPIWSG